MDDFAYIVPDDLSGLPEAQQPINGLPTAPASQRPVTLPHTRILNAGEPVSGVAVNNYTWADDWFFEQIGGFCGLSAAAFIVNQFVGAGVFDADSMAIQALDLGLPSDVANATTMQDIAHLVQASGINTIVRQACLDDVVACLNAGVGVLVAVESGRTLLGDAAVKKIISGSDSLLILTQIDTNKGVATLANPSCWSGSGIEVPLALVEDAWEGSDWQMIQTTSTNGALNPDDIVPTIDGGIARIALLNLTRRKRIH